MEGHLREQLVEAAVRGQLGVEGGDEDAPVAAGHRVRAGGICGSKSGEDLDCGPEADDAGGSDEHGWEGSSCIGSTEPEVGTGVTERGVEGTSVEERLEGAPLAPVPVPADGALERAEGALVGPAVEDGGSEQDQPGAGAEDGHAALDRRG